MWSDTIQFSTPTGYRMGFTTHMRKVTDGRVRLATTVEQDASEALSHLREERLARGYRTPSNGPAKRRRRRRAAVRA